MSVSLHIDTEREGGRLKITLFALGWNNYKSEVVENWFGEDWETCALGKQELRWEHVDAFKQRSPCGRFELGAEMLTAAVR